MLDDDPLDMARGIVTALGWSVVLWAAGGFLVWLFG